MHRPSREVYLIPAGKISTLLFLLVTGTRHWSHLQQGDIAQQNEFPIIVGLAKWYGVRGLPFVQSLQCLQKCLSWLV